MLNPQPLKSLKIDQSDDKSLETVQVLSYLLKDKLSKELLRPPLRKRRMRHDLISIKIQINRKKVRKRPDFSDFSYPISIFFKKIRWKWKWSDSLATTKWTLNALPDLALKQFGGTLRLVNEVSRCWLSARFVGMDGAWNVNENTGRKAEKANMKVGV